MKVTINMPKAREIHRQRIRAARAPMLAQLDLAFMQEMERPRPNTAAIIASKQRLRDLPDSPDIEAAATIDELKACWPEPDLGPCPYKLNL